MRETRETWVWSLGQEDPLEKEMATHTSIPAWRIPWIEEPGGLQSTESQRVGHDWVTETCTPNDLGRTVINKEISYRGIYSLKDNRLKKGMDRLLSGQINGWLDLHLWLRTCDILLQRGARLSGTRVLPASYMSLPTPSWSVHVRNYRKAGTLNEGMRGWMPHESLAL